MTSRPKTAPITGVTGQDGADLADQSDHQPLNQ